MSFTNMHLRISKSYDVNIKCAYSMYLLPRYTPQEMSDVVKAAANSK